MTRKTDPATTKAVHDKIKDWGNDPKNRKYLQYSPSTNSYWCEDHVLILNGGAAANHAKEHIKSDILKKTKAIDPSKMTAADKKLLDGLESIQAKPVEQSENFIPTSSDLLIDSINKSFADSMAGLAKDPEFLYGFFILKENGMIPYDWDAGTFLKACYKKYLRNFKISFSLNQDMTKLSDEDKTWQIEVMEENADIRKQIEENTVTVTPETESEDDGD